MRFPWGKDPFLSHPVLDIIPFLSAGEVTHIWFPVLVWHVLWVSGVIWFLRRQFTSVVIYLVWSHQLYAIWFNYRKTFIIMGMETMDYVLHFKVITSNVCYVNSGWMLPKIAPVTASRGKREQLVFQWGPHNSYCFIVLHSDYTNLIYRHLLNHVLFTAPFFCISVLDKVIRNQKGTCYLIENEYYISLVHFAVYWACSELPVIFLYGLLDTVRQGIFQSVCVCVMETGNPVPGLIYIDSLSVAWGLLMPFIPFK